MKQLKKTRKRKGYIRIVLLVFFLIVVIKLIVGIKSNTVQTVMVQYGEVKVEEKVTGIIIRNEMVIKAPISGYVSFVSKENVRVPVNSKLVEVRRERIDDGVLKRYNEIVEEINSIEVSNIQTQSNMSRSLSNISRLIATRNYSMVYSEKERMLKELYLEKSSQDNTDIDKLIKERKKLEDMIGNGVKSECAAFAGIPVYSLDGYEEVLNSDHLLEVDPSEFQPDEYRKTNFDKEVKIDQPVLKLVDNYKWYLVVQLNSDFGSSLKKGDRVTLDFDEENYNGVRATIIDMKQCEDILLVAFEIKDQVPGYLKKRVTEVNVVKAKYSGYVIPVQALLSKNNKTGVMVLEEEKLVFKEVVIKGDNGVNAVIESTNNRSQLKLYDKVIVNPGINGGGVDEY